LRGLLGVANPEEKAPALHGPLPGEADLPFGFVAILDMTAFVFQNQGSAIVQAGEEIGIEPVGQGSLKLWEWRSRLRSQTSTSGRASRTTASSVSGWFISPTLG
jgi:hypothetical protein